jgi:hypothetical protein
VGAYFVFEAARFLRSAQHFFISKDNFLRPAAVIPCCLGSEGFLAVTDVACRLELFVAVEPFKIWRAAVSLAISESSSRMILAVST